MKTATDSAGLFRLNLIPTGEYKVEVSAPGFQTAVQSGVLVTAGSNSSVAIIKLTVGEATTTVEVTAEAPLIETNQSQVTNTFTGAAIATFAGVQENEGLDNLALFVPGVSPSRDNNFSNLNGGTGLSVNGLQQASNNDQQIDGQNNNDNSAWRGRVSLLPMPNGSANMFWSRTSLALSTDAMPARWSISLPKAAAMPGIGSRLWQRKQLGFRCHDQFAENFDTNAAGQTAKQTTPHE